jgi:para-nitrobenzyl esterase
MHAKSIGGILTWLALATPLIAQTPADSAKLAGTSWRLVKFEGGDGKVMRPPSPDSFTLEFLQSDGLALRVDCNRGRGTWKSTPPSGIEIKPQILTRAYCGTESMHDQVLRHLPLVRSYVMKNGHLFLSLMADGGIYEYEPMKAALK